MKSMSAWRVAANHVIFRSRKLVQSGSPDTRIGTNPSSAAFNNNILSGATAELARHF
jgi:hypothetical protein